MKARIRQLRGEGGQDLIEFAFIFPLLLFLLLGIMDFGIVIFQYNTVANAAREGARSGIISTRTATEIEAAARVLTTGLNQDPSMLDINVLQLCSSSAQVQVEVLYQANLISGSFLVGGGSPTIPLRSVATMRCE